MEKPIGRTNVRMGPRESSEEMCDNTQQLRRQSEVTRRARGYPSTSAWPRLAVWPFPRRTCFLVMLNLKLLLTANLFLAIVPA